MRVPLLLPDTQKMKSLTQSLKQGSRDYLRPEVAAWAATSGAAIVAALATAFLLTGCATESDTHVKPIDPVTLESIHGLAPQGTRQWPDQRWWNHFGDPALDSLIDEALAGNPNLQVAQARLAQAQAQAGVARAQALPSVQADGSSSRGRFSGTYIFPPPLGGASFTTNQLLLDFGWDLDFWGKNRAAIAAASATVNADEADRDAATLALTTSVARTWFQLNRLYLLRDVTEASIKQREDILTLTRQRVNAGLDTNVELRQAESELPQAKVDLAEIDESIELTRHQLAALLGEGPDRGLAIPRPAPAGIVPVSLPGNLPADLIGRRPDLVAARWRVEAAARGIDNARAQFYPDINLAASAGYVSLGWSNFLTRASEQTGFGPAISLPLYRPALNANLHGREAEYDAAVATYNQTLVDALKDVSDQVTSLRALAGEAQQQQEALAKVEEAYDLAVQRYKAGLGTYLTVLTAESSVLQQRRIYAEMKARALELDVSLVRALGGGFASEPPAIAQR